MDIDRTRPAGDLDRLRREATRRKESTTGRDWKSLQSPGDHFMIQSRQRDLLALLRRERALPLEDRKILEVGAGSGGVLRELLWLGAHPQSLHGAELLHWRTVEAAKATPHLPLVTADGRNLPYPDKYFDIVMQFTVFSSILDDGVRKAVSAEMIRVLKPGGIIVWYDFWLNPTNRKTRGVRPDAIRALFPGCQLSFKRITLAPPLVRLLAPVSWTLCHMLERLRILNSHYLVVISPRTN